MLIACINYFITGCKMVIFLIVSPLRVKLPLLHTLKRTVEKVVLNSEDNAETSTNTGASWHHLRSPLVFVPKTLECSHLGAT